MPKESFTLTLLFSISLALTAPLSAADEEVRLKKNLDKANEYIKVYRHFEAGDALQEATKLGGAKHPSIHMRLGILYYGLGLIPEAIAEGEKAVALAPSSKWFKFDLAKFYYVDKQYLKAEQQVTALLKLDPGFTLGYYYLAELYFRKKDFDLAWLSFQRARLLGYQGKRLEEKLALHTNKPVEDFVATAKKNMLFRFIKLSREEEAKTIIDQILQGKLFENLELDLKNEKFSETDFGLMGLNEFQDSTAESLKTMQAYSAPIVIKTASDYRIIQSIAPFDPVAWRSAIATTTTIPKDLKTNTPALAAVKKTAGTARIEPSTAASTATKEDALESQQTPIEKDKEQLSTQLAAYYALESWKNAWKSADVSRYLAAYSSDFTPPDEMDFATWKKKRTASLTRPKFIHITIKDPVVELLTDNHLLNTFTQDFESDTYQDSVIKILTMALEKGSWKIREERSIQEPYR